MKPLANGAPQRALAVLAASLLVLLGGCKTVNSFNSKHDTTFGKKREVANVHQTRKLPSELRRVAVLPLYKGQYDYIEMDPIEENFVQEITKLNLFEVVAVDSEKMIELFGQPSFSSVEFLPTKLLTRLHELYAIDGVLFLDVTYFNAYQPVGLGVRAKLLDGHSGEIVWAADELFDAADPAVSNAARKFFQTKSVNEYPLGTQTQTVLHSPTRFSKYVAHALFSTIQ